MTPEVASVEAVDLESAVSAWLDEGFAILALYGIRPDGSCACGNPGCEVPGKHPRHRHGAYSATRNLDRIQRWIHGYAHLNLGLACQGFHVLDADGRAGEQSLEKLQELYGAEFTDTRNQRSGNGRHLIYRGGPQTTSSRYTGHLPGLHLRGGPGAYVVGAPSLHRSGKRYQADETPIAQLPGFASVPPPGSERPPAAPLPGGLRGSRYGLAALRGELGRLLPLQPGQGRHNSLNVSSFRLGQLVVAGQLEPPVAYDGLLRAAEAIGLTEPDARRIIVSGLEAGIRCPR
jgi:Bifunctional DNA primase/polymerase, N-terminal